MKEIYLSWKLKEPLDAAEVKCEISALRGEYTRTWLEVLGGNPNLENEELPGIVRFCCATADPKHGWNGLIDPQPGQVVPECFALKGRIADKYCDQLLARLAVKDVHVEVRAGGSEHDHYAFRRSTRRRAYAPLLGSA